MAHRLTTCTFCGVGCGIYLETAGRRVVGAYPSMSHPTNQGRICLRGWHVHEVCSSPDRLRSPLLRRNGKLVEVTWDEAITFIATRLKELRAKYGPDSLAFLCSPRCSNEEVYLLQKLARTVVGTNNVDHGTGVYCNNSIKVLLDMLGVAASTNSIGELARSDVIIVDGVDLGRQMPTIGGIVIRAKLAGAKLIVIDSRRHRVAESADIFLQILPGTEAVLYGAMAKVIVDAGLANLPFIKARCRQYEDFLSAVRDYDLLEAADYCGVAPELLESAALAYARGKSAAILYSTGIESRDSEPIQALVNLALLTGHIGREGAGIYPLTEHNNLQGACDMGMMPDRLPGYRPVTDAAQRALLERIWGAQVPAQPGIPAGSVLADRGEGRIRGAWLCRYDPVSSAFHGDAAQSLGQCELLVAQHLFLTESAKLANVVLPSTAYGEERVTFTSTDRRIQLADQVIPPLPGTLPAWQQLCFVAEALGAHSHFRFQSSAQVMDEIGTVIPAYSGANYPNLAADFGRQWPCTLERPLGTRFLFADPQGSPPFRFAQVPARFQKSPAGDFPLRLIFGNSAYYWNQNILIRHSEILKREYRILLLDYPEGFVDVNTEDARLLNVRDGERIRLRTRDGSAVTTARVTEEVRRGTVLVPFFVRQVQQQVLGATRNGLHPIAARIEKEAA